MYVILSDPFDTVSEERTVRVNSGSEESLYNHNYGRK
jgi:hypothetical protein